MNQPTGRTATGSSQQPTEVGFGQETEDGLGQREPHFDAGAWLPPGRPAGSPQDRSLEKELSPTACCLSQKPACCHFL